MDHTIIQRKRYYIMESLCVFFKRLLHTLLQSPSKSTENKAETKDQEPRFVQTIETPFKYIPHHLQLCQVFSHGLLISLAVLDIEEFSLQIHEEGGDYETLGTCLAMYWPQ